MEKENKLSIWVGKFPSESAFADYIGEEYDDDGEMTSGFMKDFDIEFYDADFSESLFLENPNDREQVAEFSYSESFLDQLDLDNIPVCNSYLIIYNFEYDGKIIQNDKLEFLGSFDYQQ